MGVLREDGGFQKRQASVFPYYYLLCFQKKKKNHKKNNKNPA